MSGFYSVNGGAGSIYVQFDYGPAAAPPICECGKHPIAHNVDFGPGKPRKLLCVACAELAVRNAAISRAETWITEAFKATAPDLRSKLYRSLAAAFHPDTGGDPRLMTALNAVRERFP